MPVDLITLHRKLDLLRVSIFYKVTVRPPREFKNLVQIYFPTPYIFSHSVYIFPLRIYFPESVYISLFVSIDNIKKKIMNSLVLYYGTRSRRSN